MKTYEERIKHLVDCISEASNRNKWHDIKYCCGELYKIIEKMKAKKKKLNKGK